MAPLREVENELQLVFEYGIRVHLGFATFHSATTA
jgi:hypothetical protein